MSRFTETLQQTQARLAIPQPARSRLLLEMAADMEDLYQSYREQGLGEEEARQRVLGRMDLSDGALFDLSQIHTGLWRRFLDGLSTQARSRWERGALLFLLLFALLVSGRVLLAEHFFEDASRFVWPVLACAGAAIALGVLKYYRLFLRQDHDVQDLRRGLTPILLLAGFQIGLGFLGLWLELYLIVRRMAQSGVQAEPLLLDWLIGGSALLVVSLLGAILSALIWYVLAAKTARIEAHAAAFLLED